MTRFPPPPPGAERRAHPRHDVVVAVEVAHDDTIAIATLVNLSHGGAFVEVADVDALSVGVRLRVTLAAAGKEVKAEAKVVRVTGTGFALAWRAPSAPLHKLIDRLLATPVPAPAPAPVPAPASASVEAAVDAGW